MAHYRGGSFGHDFLTAIGVLMKMSEKYPEPTVERPDFETLEDWMWNDGGCEATDGCWVEYDGTCPHGHVSWFIYLGPEILLSDELSA